MKTFLLLLIKAYQVSLSPDHGWLAARYPYGFCRYYPSCSEYAHRAVSQHGLTRGAWLSLQRILRCVPWKESRVDHVPAQAQ